MHESKRTALTANRGHVSLVSFREKNLNSTWNPFKEFHKGVALQQTGSFEHWKTKEKQSFLHISI